MINYYCIWKTILTEDGLSAYITKYISWYNCYKKLFIVYLFIGNYLIYPRIIFINYNKINIICLNIKFRSNLKV